ncbi:hypothetical protein HRR83_003554 [Exophiala dermatitidis]|uniref:Uncharacterized protein n=1 Tax=Exophiala dermatitidis TaxID=5970 RepID=A0AAN6EXD2_EXODE|nr:hypothetical protein HRR74_003069 [Exophiala dermatitidis]KAJ4529808.1 hypothetical protein HRR73_000836 [Exophiala dermatitidis]KAJ4543025.1 hypothetical protein HRR77_005286 [Exophiala dermatitidis]KAJ4543525.1 hypothetical protein HRR76_001594 [Exophiala dermatitidis]KAJ4574989.1 hypothetical protein HRR79_001924 [Exophiala dermatitidis]
MTKHVQYQSFERLQVPLTMPFNHSHAQLYVYCVCLAWGDGSLPTMYTYLMLHVAHLEKATGAISPREKATKSALPCNRSPGQAKRIDLGWSGKLEDGSGL